MTTHTTPSDAALALGRSRAPHTPPAPSIEKAKKRPWPPKQAPSRRRLIAAVANSEIELTCSRNTRYENSNRNKFAVSENAPSLRWVTRLALATDHPSLITGFEIDSQNHLQMVLTRSKSIECNFAIDRPIGARVPIARPCHGGTNPCLEEENKRKQRRGARLTYGV